MIRLHKGWLVTICAVQCLTVMAADVKAPKCQTVVDSGTQTVGSLSGVVTPAFSGTTSISLFSQIDGALYPLQVVDQGLYGLMDQGVQGSDAVYWKSPDCSGTPYLAISFGGSLGTPAPPWTRTAVAGPGLLLYAQTAGSAEELFEYQSAMSRGDLACNSCGGSCGNVIAAVPAGVVLNLGTRFTPPFRIVVGNCQ